MSISLAVKSRSISGDDVSFFVTLTGFRAGGGGGLLNKFDMRRLRPEIQTLTLKHTHFYQNGTPFIYLEQNCTLSYISRVSQNNIISYNRHVFPGFSVAVLIQFRSHSAKLWYPLIYFALATISSTLQLIF